MPPYFDANGEFWTAVEGHLYHVKGDTVIRSDDLIPLADELRELAMVTPNKGWALTNTALLAYDGVFWTEVPGVPGAGVPNRGGIDSDAYPLISVLSENEVWFANGYKYINGRYEQFSQSRFRSIKMQDGQNGVLMMITGNNYGYDWRLTVYADGIWIETGLFAGSIAADKSGNIWFRDNQ